MFRTAKVLGRKLLVEPVTAVHSIYEQRVVDGPGTGFENATRCTTQAVDALTVGINRTVNGVLHYGGDLVSVGRDFASLRPSRIKQGFNKLIGRTMGAAWNVTTSPIIGGAKAAGYTALAGAKAVTAPVRILTANTTLDADNPGEQSQIMREYEGSRLDRAA